MGYYCWFCGTQYNHTCLLENRTPSCYRKSQLCHIEGCGAQVVHIDDIIAPAIILLNKKGYYTEGCCSGHLRHDTTGGFGFYVMFREDTVNKLCGMHSLPKLPDLFYNDENSIRTNVVQAQDFSLILKINTQFYNWCKQIPTLGWGGE